MNYSKKKRAPKVRVLKDHKIGRLPGLTCQLTQAAATHLHFSDAQQGSHPRSHVLVSADLQLRAKFAHGARAVIQIPPFILDSTELPT